tara:strand:- start:108 stop:344 length:237 start_codon:yes stop_codon:yes gene_type:complete
VTTLLIILAVQVVVKPSEVVKHIAKKGALLGDNTGAHLMIIHIPITGQVGVTVLLIMVTAVGEVMEVEENLVEVLVEC